MSTAALNAFVFRTSTSTSTDSPGPLNGWDVGVKLNIATSAGPTTCASGTLSNYRSPYAATAVSLLESAGATVAGKTNMDEFGMGSKTIFSIHGPTLNPATAEGDSEPRTAGGSSGGSAAAVAAGQCRVALGSDTGGSVRLPAAWCGVVGFKPTYGRISRHGLVSYGSSLDTVGVLARTVDDIRSAFKVMSAPDVHDMTCMSQQLRDRIDRLVAQSRPPAKDPSRPLSGVRIGLPAEYWVDELSTVTLDAWRSGAARLASLGADIVSVSLPHTKSALPVYYTIALAEASSNLARYDGIRYGQRSDEQPPINTTNASQKYANTRSEGFGDEVQRRILLGTYVMTSAACQHFYTPAQKLRRLIQHDFDAVFALPNAMHPGSSPVKDGVDAILFPTAIGPAPRLHGNNEGSRVEAYVNDVMTVPASLAGLPAVSVPVGTSPDGLPVGLQLAAQYGDDAFLLETASRLAS
ncbi:Trimeric GatFAB AmidoTransferase(AdT) complex subunit [Linderina macrospora]|uniref:Trimeric GatFAB AmidoTransferase(AdT) complex subunit n=1 Tax=Linderina macrospora TaxID=4868 RepID=A0ACC1JEW9_9FUNG|nr:Trimeric GatFAB AmidoTransferase(AdT) complex subunit [Linderina macrospora]